MKILDMKLYLVQQSITIYPNITNIEAIMAGDPKRIVKNKVKPDLGTLSRSEMRQLTGELSGRRARWAQMGLHPGAATGLEVKGSHSVGRRRAFVPHPCLLCLRTAPFLRGGGGEKRGDAGAPALACARRRQRELRDAKALTQQCCLAYGSAQKADRTEVPPLDDTIRF